MSIFIRAGKGNKDRYTTLSNTALETIRIYYKLYWPKEYLFPGTMKNKPITSRTVQQAFTIILQRTRIQKDLTVHSIRHSFSTHMLENGVDVYHLQKLLGHSNIKTTSIYLHISNHKALKIQSPHDRLIAGTDDERR